MKRLLIVLALVVMASIITIAQTNNNLYWSNRIKVKMDKKLEFEKKLPALLKTHYPQFKFRTYEVLTGKNTGTYVVVAGPISYKDLDAPPVFPKGEALAKTDDQALAALCESYEVNYFLRQDDISTNNPNRKIKYLEVTSFELAPGQWQRMHDVIVEAREAISLAGSKSDYAFFRPSSSGPSNAFNRVRYVEKLEELGIQEDWAGPYDKVHGANAFSRKVEDYYSLIKSYTDELRVLREDMSVN